MDPLNQRMMDQLGTDFHATGSVMTPSQLKEYRMKRGECVTCGRKCFQKRLLRMIPLTDAGRVLKGRCLNCNPINNGTSQACTSTGSGGGAASLLHGGTDGAANPRRATREDLARFSRSQSNLARVGGLSSNGNNSAHSHDNNSNNGVKPGLTRSAQSVRSIRTTSMINSVGMVRTKSLDDSTPVQATTNMGGRRPLAASGSENSNSGSGEFLVSLRQQHHLQQQQAMPSPSTPKPIISASQGSGRSSMGVISGASISPRRSSMPLNEGNINSKILQQQQAPMTPQQQQKSFRLPVTSTDRTPSQESDIGLEEDMRRGLQRSKLRNAPLHDSPYNGNTSPVHGQGHQQQPLPPQQLQQTEQRRRDYARKVSNSIGDGSSEPGDPRVHEHEEEDLVGYSGRNRDHLSGSAHEMMNRESSYYNYRPESRSGSDISDHSFEDDLVVDGDVDLGYEEEYGEDDVNHPSGVVVGGDIEDGDLIQRYEFERRDSYGPAGQRNRRPSGGDEESFTNASENYDDYAPLPEFRPTGEEIQDALERITGRTYEDMVAATPAMQHQMEGGAGLHTDEQELQLQQQDYHDDHPSLSPTPSSSIHNNDGMAAVSIYDGKSQRSFNSHNSGIMDMAGRTRSRESLSNRSFSDRSGHNTEEEITAYESARAQMKHGLLNRGGLVDLARMSNSHIDVPLDKGISHEDLEEQHYDPVIFGEEEDNQYVRDNGERSSSFRSFNSHGNDKQGERGSGRSYPNSSRKKYYSSISARSLDSMSSLDDMYDVHPNHNSNIITSHPQQQQPVEFDDGTRQALGTVERQESMGSFPSQVRTGRSSTQSLPGSAHGGRQTSREYGLHSSSHHQRSFHSAEGGGGSGGQPSQDAMHTSVHSMPPPARGPGSKDKYNGSDSISFSNEGDTMVNSSASNVNGGAASSSRQNSQNLQLSSNEEGLMRLNEADGDVAEIVHVMRDFFESASVQSNCMHELANLQMTADDCDAVAEAGGLEAIVDAMERFPQNEDLQMCASRALCNVAGTPENQMALLEVGAVDVLLGITMENFANQPELQEHALAALANLAALEANLEPLLGKNVVIRVVQSMNKHGDDNQVQMNGCTVITNLASHSTPLKVSVMMAGGGGAVVMSMVLHSKDPQVQEKGLEALRNLSANCDENKAELAHIGGIDASISAMQVHRDDPYVQEAGAWALCNLAGITGNKEHIGRSSGVDVIVRAMWVHSDQVSVHEWCMRALYTLSVLPSNGKLIMDIGGIAAVVNSMQAHEKSSVVQEMGCGILCNLAAEEQVKVKIVDDEALDAIVLAMVLFSDDAKVQERACEVLLQLAVAKNVTSLRATNVVELVRAAADKFPDSCRGPADEFQGMMQVFTMDYNNSNANTGAPSGVSVIGGGR